MATGLNLKAKESKRIPPPHYGIRGQETSRMHQYRLQDALIRKEIMSSSATRANDLVQDLAGLVSALAAIGVTVNSLRADFSVFGSWAIETHEESRDIRYIWDGRDRVLMIETSDKLRQNSPPIWKQETIKGPEITSESSVNFARDYIFLRFRS